MQEALCDLLDGEGKESLEIAVCREASEKSPRAFWAFQRLGYLQVLMTIALWFLLYIITWLSLCAMCCWKLCYYVGVILICHIIIEEKKDSTYVLFEWNKLHWLQQSFMDIFMLYHKFQVHQRRWSEAVQSLQHAIRGFPACADLWEVCYLTSHSSSIFDFLILNIPDC